MGELFIQTQTNAIASRNFIKMKILLYLILLNENFD